MISYYDEFLSTLHEDSPSTTILGLSLAGHEEYELSSPLSLQQQIENKVRIVDMILSSPPFSSLSPVPQDTTPKLVVMGHSVGAYMALQVLKQRPQNVDHTFLLFPTISHISKGGIFSRFSSLMTSIPGVPKLLGWMTFLLRFIFPIPLLALLLRVGHSLPGTSLTTTLYKFFNPSSVHSFCHLAKHEFREIKELDVDSLTKYSKRITACFAVKDRWVPQFARDQIISIVNTNGGDAIICNEGFPHAFSLGNCPWSSEMEMLRVVHGPQMAKKISLWISTLFHPVMKSPLAVSPKGVSEFMFSNSVSWTSVDQESDTLVNTSPDLGRRPERKESLGAGVVIRERLIRDLE